MQTNCKNCDNNFEGNFCNNCGQTAHTHKINWHYLWHDIQHGIFHVDSGILYTIKELLLKPGITIRNFIDGKRAPYFKPVAMIFLLATIYGLLFHYFHIEIPTSENDNEKLEKVITDINNWIAGHFALSTLLLIPINALSSYFAFKKSGYNYIEHGVLNLYTGSVKVVINFVLFPLLYIYNHTPKMGIILSVWLFLDILITGYVYFGFFNNYKLGNRLLKIILSVVYFYILLMILVFIISIFIAFLFLT